MPKEGESQISRFLERDRSKACAYRKGESRDFGLQEEKRGSE